MIDDKIQKITERMAWACGEIVDGPVVSVEAMENALAAAALEGYLLMPARKIAAVVHALGEMVRVHGGVDTVSPADKSNAYMGAVDALRVLAMPDPPRDFHAKSFADLVASLSETGQEK